MVASPFEWKILEWNEKHHTIKKIISPVCLQMYVPFSMICRNKQFDWIKKISLFCITGVAYIILRLSFKTHQSASRNIWFIFRVLNSFKHIHWFDFLYIIVENLINRNTFNSYLNHTNITWFGIVKCFIMRFVRVFPVLWV